MKLVKFKNGKYGVRTGSWLLGYEFLCGEYYGWNGLKNVMKYCQFETLEEAQEIIDNNPIKHKVVK